MLVQVGYSRVFGGGSYAGPGDVVASATAWWGLRAYSAAAAGSTAVRLIRASDSAQQDFVTLANGSLDVASIATFMASTTAKVVTLNDQVSTFHLTQATDAKRPAFILSALGSLPCIRFDAASGQYLAASAWIGIDPPIWTSYVAKRTGNTSNFNAVIKNSDNGLNIGFSNSANLIYEYNGNVVTVAAADNAVHAVQNYISGSGTGDGIYLDGSNNALSSAGTVVDHLGVVEISGDGAGQNLTGDLFEVGAWSGDKTASNSAMNSNQHTYWGF